MRFRSAFKGKVLPVANKVDELNLRHSDKRNLNFETSLHKIKTKKAKTKKKQTKKKITSFI